MGPVSDLLDFNESDRELQMATDAFALRHHAAESLMRLYGGLTTGIENQGPVRCLWSAIAEGPIKTVDLVGRSRAHLRSMEGQRNFWKLVFPEAVAFRPDLEQQANQALNVSVTG